MREERTVNLTDKPLKDFIPGDTLYISVLKSDYQYTYFCKFIELKHGIVIADVIKLIDKIGYINLPIQLRVRPNKCFLWGRDVHTHLKDWHRCYWFKNTEEPAK